MCFPSVNVVNNVTHLPCTHDPDYDLNPYERQFGHQIDILEGRLLSLSLLPCWPRCR